MKSGVSIVATKVGNLQTPTLETSAFFFFRCHLKSKRGTPCEETLSAMTYYQQLNHLLDFHELLYRSSLQKVVKHE